MGKPQFSVDSLPELKGKTFLVTGGNAGIGYSTVVALASHGARVYMGGRNETSASAAIEQIKRELPSADVEFLHLDLASLDSVVEAAKVLRTEEDALHGLVNNAGIMGVPYSVTGDGYESQFQTNYLSHWLLTYHMLPLLSSTAKAEGSGAARIVNLTSDGHSRYTVKEGIDFKDVKLESSSSMTRYGHSKLANILHTKALNKRYGPSGGEASGAEIWVAAVHPGHIDTKLNKQATAMAPQAVLRALSPVMRCLGILEAEENGALSSLYTVASPDFRAGDSGSYFVPHAKVGTPSEMARDPELAERLWTWTVEEMSKNGKLGALGSGGKGQ